MGTIFDSTVKGKEAFHKLDTVSDSKSALASYRVFVIKSDEAIRTKRASLDKKIKAITERYQPSVANPMISELRTTFNNERKATQNRLNERLDEMLQAKEEACRKYVMTPPSADQLALLQTLKMRNAKEITSEEWNMIVSSLSGNYQCASVLSTIAKESGKEFVPPFSPTDGLEDIKQFRARADYAIRNIGDLENSYIGMEFLAVDNPDTFTSALIKKLDTEIATTVPSPSVSIIGRLKDARNHALHVGDMDVFNAIANFIIGSGDQLQTPEEQEIALMEKAEKMIALGMNAKEKNPMRPAQYTEEEKRLMGEYLIARDQGKAE